MIFPAAFSAAKISNCIQVVIEFRGGPERLHCSAAVRNCLFYSRFNRNCDKHYSCDLDKIAGQEGNYAGCQGSAQCHLCLCHEPGSTEYIEDCCGEEHGDEHNGIFADAGGVSAITVVEETCYESHGDVADDIAACDAKSDAEAAGPPCEYGNSDAAQEHVDQLAEGAELSAQKDSREQNGESCQ